MGNAFCLSHLVILCVRNEITFPNVIQKEKYRDISRETFQKFCLNCNGYFKIYTLSWIERGQSSFRFETQFTYIFHLKYPIICLTVI